MAEIVLFHHVRGLTDGVLTFAETLREAGHSVHTPGLFGGLTFATTEEGSAFVESQGRTTFVTRVAEVSSLYPSDVVYGGMSFGGACAAQCVLRRPGAKGGFFLYGAIAPSWWGATWPDGVPSQVHVAEHDSWREPEAEEEYAAAVPGGEIFVYPASGHLFAEVGSDDYDGPSAALMTERVLEFLSRL